MLKRAVRILFCNFPSLETRYQRLRYRYIQWRELQRERRNARAYAKLAVQDPDDPRVKLMHERAFFTPSPMEMDVETARHLLDRINQHRVEIRNIQDQRRAAAKA